MNKLVDLNRLNSVNEQEQVQGLLLSSEQEEQQETMEVTD